MFDANVRRLGVLPLQHHTWPTDTGGNFPHQREAVFAMRVAGREAPQHGGRHIEEGDTVGDVLGSQLWDVIRAKRPIPAWRFSWPVVMAGKMGVSEPQRSAPMSVEDSLGRLDLGRNVTPPKTGRTRVAGVSLSQSMLPVRNRNYEKDDRFVEKSFPVPKLKTANCEVDGWPKFPIGFVGLSVPANEDRQQDELYLHADPRLVAVHKAGDPATGSLVVDLTKDSEVDGCRMGRLQSHLRVLKAPLARCDRVDKLAQLAWNCTRSGQGDVEGALMFGKATSSPGQVTGTDLVAFIAAEYGGPIDMGGPDDIHIMGKDGDDHAITPAHISGEAFYRFGDGGQLDAPLLHDGADDGRPAEGGPGKAPVIFVYDPELKHSDACGREHDGRHRWFASVPYVPSTPTDIWPPWRFPPVSDPPHSFPRDGIPPFRPGPPPGAGGPNPDDPPPFPTPGGDDAAIPPDADGLPPQEGGGWDPARGPLPVGPETHPRQFPGFPPYDENDDDVEGLRRLGLTYPDFTGAPRGKTGRTGVREDFVDNPRTTGFSQMVFRASWFGDGAPNFCQWKDPGPGALAYRQGAAPAALRLETWAAQRGTQMVFDYQNEPNTSRYDGMGTSAGGIMVLPPEVSLEEVANLDEPTSQSESFFALHQGVALSVGGVPDTTTGGVYSGWTLSEDFSSSDLIFRRGAGSPWTPSANDNILRFDTSDNILLDLGQGEADPGTGASGVIALRNMASAPSGSPGTDSMAIWLDGVDLRARDDGGDDWVLNQVDDVGRIQPGRKGTALVSGDILLSGWGSTATKTAFRGTDTGFSVTITSGGTGITASPTAILTFSDGTYTAAPVTLVQKVGGSDSGMSIATVSNTATTASVGFSGTPTSGQTVILHFITIATAS